MPLDPDSSALDNLAADITATASCCEFSARLGTPPSPGFSSLLDIALSVHFRKYYPFHVSLELTNHRE